MPRHSEDKIEKIYQHDHCPNCKSTDIYRIDICGQPVSYWQCNHCHIKYHVHPPEQQQTAQPPPEPAPQPEPLPTTGEKLKAKLMATTPQNIPALNLELFADYSDTVKAIIKQYSDIREGLEYARREYVSCVDKLAKVVDAGDKNLIKTKTLADESRWQLSVVADESVHAAASLGNEMRQALGAELTIARNDFETARAAVVSKLKAEGLDLDNSRNVNLNIKHPTLHPLDARLSAMSLAHQRLSAAITAVTQQMETTAADRQKFVDRLAS